MSATTDGYGQMQTRIAAFQRELDLAKRELLLTKHEIEVLQANHDRYRSLLERVVAVDEACTGEAYAALEVQL